MDEGTIFYWWLVCDFGDTIWIQGPTTTPPVDLAKIRCPYHDTPMRTFLPLDVKG